jgi:ATP adenylyltransferase
MEYIRSLHEESGDDGCFLCRYWAEPANDRTNRVVWRLRSAFAVMNRFPYINGHLLVAHSAHKGEFAELSDDELCEMTRAMRDGVTVLRLALRAEGFNIGYNVGQCAGAGLPGHLHAHVVPRWSGDTNYMAVIGDVRVLSDALDATYAELVRAAGAIGLRPSEP